MASPPISFFFSLLFLFLLLGNLVGEENKPPVLWTFSSLSFGTHISMVRLNMFLSLHDFPVTWELQSLHQSLMNILYRGYNTPRSILLRSHCFFLGGGSCCCCCYLVFFFDNWHWCIVSVPFNQEIWNDNIPIPLSDLISFWNHHEKNVYCNCYCSPAGPFCVDNLGKCFSWQVYHKGLFPILMGSDLNNSYTLYPCHLSSALNLDSGCIFKCVL